MRLIKFVLFCLIFPGYIFAADEKQLIFFDPNQLAYNKKQIVDNDAVYVKVFKKLCEQADIALLKGPYSVVYKKTAPPSGDKHDYMSLGPYWWPDTTKPDGLPYIRRDGEVNPERYLYDNVELKSLDTAVTTLSLAYYFSDKEVYAQNAASLIRIWFLDENTRMNPHLKYGQAIRGKSEGRGVGIIDTRALVRIAESIGLIGTSVSWAQQDQRGSSKI